ncbi:MAG: nucleotide pyrophosphohydrolase [Chloroflexi bacterium]|nr:nucleotide pyrophosphohydrolase [Chloroflexota bacterium]
MNDQDTCVADLKTAIAAFTSARRWKPFFSPKNLAMSIAIEAAELMEVFQWVDNAEATALAQASPHRDRMADELADVLIYCLTLANALELDVSTSITRKMDANGRKYPVEPVSPITER